MTKGVRIVLSVVVRFPVGRARTKSPYRGRRRGAPEFYPGRRKHEDAARLLGRGRQCLYSQPVQSGEVCLSLEKAPKNGVVIAVISNTDYVYEGEASRTTRHDYSLEMVAGATGTADRTTQWFLND